MWTVKMKPSLKVCFFLHFVLLSTHFAQSLPDKVNIGGLFESNNDVLEMSFRYAIDRVNSNSYILGKTKLEAKTELVTPDDSFHASKKMCNILRSGVAGMFGPRSPSSASHVQSISDTLGLPHIEFRWDFKTVRPEYSLNLYPHPAALSKAYLELVQKWKWKSFTLVYEDNQGLVRMQELLKAEFQKDVKIFVRQLEQTDDNRPLLKEMKKVGETKIVLDCSAERLPAIFAQAQEIGLMTHYHSYLITSLDLHTVDLEPLRNSFTNITAFRIIQQDRIPEASFDKNWIFGPHYHSRTPVKDQLIKTEGALIYDAVFMFAKALYDTDRKSSRNPINIQPMNCNSTYSVPWSRGKDIIQRMKNMTVEGLTGNISFNNEGFRMNFDLDIVSYHDGELIKIGRWDSVNGVNITRTQKEMSDDAEKAIRTQHFRIVVKLTDPYVMLKEDHEKYKGNDRYEGYCVELIQLIAERWEFNYTIREVIDGKHGSPSNLTGEWVWDGMIKDLIDQTADIAIGDLTINFQREEVVDFTMPFMNLGISILYKKPDSKEHNLFSFTSPLSVDVWLYMGTAYLAVSVLLFLLARIAPSEWSNPHPCDPDPDHLENTFNLLNSMWFTIGSLMQQGSDLAPKAVSTRLVAGIWWFFTLIMISSYTANLAAFLTAERMESPINSVDDLADQTKIKYGSMESGTTRNFFKSSNLPIYQTMWSVMESSPTPVFVKDNEEGKDRVKKGGYAYLIESTANEFYTERNCQLQRVGGLLDSKSYGIATPAGSQFRPLLSHRILELQEAGQLHNLKEKWWKKMRLSPDGPCPPEEKASSSAANELGLANVGGVFVVLLGGMAMACLIGVVEFVWKTRQTVRENRGSFWSEARRELTFSLKCGTNTKPVNKKGESTDGLNLPLTNY